MRWPLVVMALCVGLGGLLAEDLHARDAARLLCLGASLALLATLSHRATAALAALSGAALALGAAAAALETAEYEAAPLAAFLGGGEAEARPVRLEGTASSTIRPSGDRSVFVMEVERLTSAGERRLSRGRVRVQVAGAAGQPRVEEGDAVAVWATLRAPSRYGTDGSFDGVAFARREGIHGLAFCKSPLLLSVQQGSPGAIAVSRRWARRTLEQRVPPGPEQGIVRAMVLGDRAGIDPETAEAFRIAGTYHVLALSGAQVALIAGGLMLLLRRLPGRPLLSAGICAAAVAVYAVFVGAETPVVRAAWMAGALLLGRGLELDGEAINMLGLAGLLLLVQHPSAIGDAGFQLSFAATAGIILLAPPLVAREARWPVLRWALAGSLAAQAALLPLLAAQFHRAAPAALLLNLVAGPLASGVLLAGFATLLLAATAPFIAPVAGEIAWALAHLLLESGRVVESVPLLDVRLPSPPFWAVAIYVAGLLLAVSSPRRAKGLLLALLGAAGMLAGRQGPAADGRLHLTVLDVGHGDALVLTSPHGRTLLVDAGFRNERFDVGERVVAPYLWESGIQRLDALLVSHAHPDHAGGTPFLLKHFRVAEAWEGIAARREAVYRDFASAASEAGVPRLALERGHVRAWDGVELRVLWPRPAGSGTGRARNDDSVVLGVRFRGTRFLLAGDIEAAAEAALSPYPAEVLKVAHHGSRTSSSEPLLDRVAPTVGLVSVGRGGLFGHPHREALLRLGRAGVRLWRTDRDGTITVSSDGTRLWLRTWAEGVERRIH